ncbi:type I-F CRISPR-associated protein Csy1 [Methylicorpusculum oleiharenae]|uniref:type I-F CRISPR-associated protein Csy1 n=1 Tax=Methylicorpusculum oleiharenae TaxID=1338687 RepID=UPI00135B2A3D|nr:type I-F CRISPR-associated protein Csy1 [Methylicorpusculum oleiharenae]MCD2453226.1 type I-F CRISPR-associated protein Csy1 [Methylicorpusculum oleiharenae]
MENPQKIIEDFFIEKTQDSVAAGFEEILKPIRDKKNNHKHKDQLEKYTKEYDAFESNQWMRKKLDKLVVIFGADERISELLQQAIDLYQNSSDHNELKTNLAAQFKSLKKEVNKSHISEQDKKYFQKIEGDKLQTDKIRKNQRLLERLAVVDDKIASAISGAKETAQEKYQRNTWINDAAQKASEVSVGMTHIAKLTHSSTKASNINATALYKNSSKPLVITVNCSKEIKKDFAYSTAAYAQIAEFLQLIGKEICINPTLLKPYAQDDNQLMDWQEQFSLAFNEKNKSSHILAKQVYFPLTSVTDYHLLAPLISSSLAQVIYNRIWEARRKDTPVNKARADETFSSEIARSFHRTAVLKATQTNHQNVSNLNGKRSGQLILLPAVPPQWQTQTKPPIHLKTIFNKQLANQAKEPLTELKNLLLAIKANKLSVNLQRKQIIRNHLADIAEVVLDYARQVQRLKEYSGWSQESKLPVHQQYWLDPLRPEEEFQTAKTTLDWSSDVIVDFSKWVNRHIKHKQLTLGATHEKQWQKLFLPLLREFNAIAEVDLETNTEEVGA